MEENIQDILKDKNEDIVQFNFENNTSNPVVVDLFDTASLLNTPTSGNQTTSYQNTQIPLNIDKARLTFNPNNNTLIASEVSNGGALRLIDLNTNTTNNNFNNVGGFNTIVRAIAIQSDGKIILGGFFTTYATYGFNFRIIRLNPDGSKDLTFDNLIGFNNSVNDIKIQPDGKIICVGQFTTYKGLTENNIIRLNPDGSKDLTFDNLIGFIGGGVNQIALQPDGKMVVCGGYISYKGVPANNIIRLNSDGTIDTSFVYGTGFNGTISSVILQPDGKILVGGIFTAYQGVINNNKIIRLNPNGSKDITFDNSIGFNTPFGNVEEMSLQSDGKIICGGSFTTYKGVSANNIIRLNSDGSIDVTFNYGVGFNDYIRAIKIQSDGKILLGGNFTQYNGISDNNYIIRLNSDGSKDLTFDNSIGFNATIESISIDSNNDIFVVGSFFRYKNFGNNRIIKISTLGISYSYLSLQGVPIGIEYCSINNTFYSAPNDGGLPANVLNSDISAIINTISFPSSNDESFGITYNVNNNCMYYLMRDLPSNAKIYVIDCNTDTIIATIPLPSQFVSELSNVTNDNYIYYYDSQNSFLQKIDCNTNTLVLINVTLPNVAGQISSLNFNPLNNNLYCMGISSIGIDIIDTTNDTYLTTITIPISNSFIPLFSTLNPITNQLFISDIDNTNFQQYAVIDCATNTLSSVQTLSNIITSTIGIVYVPTTNAVYISGSLFSVVTFTATPFFIGGSANYNTFVNSLNFEPIFVEEIRILTQNQTQLYNQLQFTKIDSNGNQIFFPEFPITKVDSFQAQGNIASLKLNGLVFDGRTYINQYVINPSEIVSFEIIYKQLDRFSATPTFPIFFKPKVQLKEYIRKDYNNYDVEM